MDTIIRDVIESDRQARERIDKANHDKFNIQKSINEERDSVTKRYMDASKDEVEQYRKELEHQIDLEKQEQEQAYQKALTQLSDLYDSKKDQWVDELVARCLNV